MITRIAHATDFSAAGQAAFAHALRLALALRSRLDLLHVHSPGRRDDWDKFPHVREVMQRWGVLPPGASVDDIAAATGVSVAKVEIRDGDAADGLAGFLNSHRPDLIVMASHGGHGVQRLFSGSVSAGVAQQTHVPTLVLGPQARPFVDEATGAMTLHRVLVPVARDPAPQSGMGFLSGFLAATGGACDFVHVGKQPPLIMDGAGRPAEVRQLDGAVVAGILAAARGSSLIAMPSDGRRGLMDALRGSTTEQVVREALCPVLVLPA